MRPAAPCYLGSVGSCSSSCRYTEKTFITHRTLFHRNSLIRLRFGEVLLSSVTWKVKARHCRFFRKWKYLHANEKLLVYREVGNCLCITIWGFQIGPLMFGCQFWWFSTLRQAVRDLVVSKALMAIYSDDGSLLKHQNRCAWSVYCMALRWSV